VQQLILATGKISCPLDPMPAPLMLECLDTLLPVITSLINLPLDLDLVNFRTFGRRPLAT
jgi:hypothetical protein